MNLVTFTIIDGLFAAPPWETSGGWKGGLSLQAERHRALLHAWGEDLYGEILYASFSPVTFKELDSADSYSCALCIQTSYQNGNTNYSMTALFFKVS